MTNKADKSTRAVTVQEYEADQRRRRQNGGPPDPRRSLWDVFNDKVSDMTRDPRLQAAKAIGDEMQRRQNHMPPTLDSAQRAQYEAELNILSQRFTDVVNGGVKGGYVALNTLLSLKGRTPTPS